jgi:NAD(P)-dependent dehydrogenase (short-subunit alcohol dehydrogenase family)
MRRLAGMVADITGAAAGPKAALGAIFAKALAAEGAKVVLADTKDCASVSAEIHSQRRNRTCAFRRRA